jgi:hypothetical protein
MLAEGTVVALERAGDVVTVAIELQASRINLLLAGVDAVRYQPHDEPMLYELDAIAASQPDIRDAEFEKGALVVRGGAGILYLSYANMAIEVDGAPIGVAGLARLRGDRKIVPE